MAILRTSNSVSRAMRIGFFLLIAICARLGAVEPTLAEYPPDSWGTDHVGKEIPNYVTGDECLFCHRQIGYQWPTNAHQLTLQPKAEGSEAIAALRSVSGGERFAEETHFLMNSGRITRYLKRSKEYGKLDLLNLAWLPDSLKTKPITSQNSNTRWVTLDAVGNARKNDSMQWHKQVFGQRCAGCHATAVDTKTKAFSAISLDCFTCHGDVSLQHTKDIKQVLLSKTNREPRHVVSICGQCHLRGGKSKSSGLPYPNSFVAGDNLFRDFRVNVSTAKLDTLTPMERHIFRNVRFVTMMGSNTTCLSCHNVHQQNADKHQELEKSNACFDCHINDSDDFGLSDQFMKTRWTSSPGRVCDY